MAEYIPNGFLIKKLHDSLEKRSNNELSEKRAGDDAGIVSRLERKGLVEALSYENDKRIKLVHITLAGRN